jgi:hypothetical protein
MTKILRLENRGGDGLLPNSSKTRLITFLQRNGHLFYCGLNTCDRPYQGRMRELLSSFLHALKWMAKYFLPESLVLKIFHS